MAWWVATRGASTKVYQSSSAVTAKALYPTYTIAGPFPTQAAANSLAGGSNMAAPAAAPAPGNAGGCGAQAIYTALLASGFSTVQAVGAMANAIAESALNPEASVIDSNGARSNGLWQFNEASYPDSGKLVTGNCAADIQQQVGYLKAHVSGQALNGSTGAEVASNFAANFERCQGCQSGGSQNAARTANAATVQGWISSGSWPTSSAGITGGASGGNVLTSTITAGTCVIPLNIPVAGQFCLLSKGQARGVLGVLLMIAGGLLLLPGVLVLAAAGLERTGAGAAAGQAAATLTPVGRAAGVARSGYRAGAERVISRREKKQAPPAP